MNSISQETRKEVIGMIQELLERITGDRRGNSGHGSKEWRKGKDLAEAREQEQRLAAPEKLLGATAKKFGVANPDLDKEIARLESRLQELEERRKRNEQERNALEATQTLAEAEASQEISEIAAAVDGQASEAEEKLIPIAAAEENLAAGVLPKASEPASETEKNSFSEMQKPSLEAEERISLLKKGLSLNLEEELLKSEAQKFSFEAEGGGTKKLTASFFSCFVGEDIATLLFQYGCNTEIFCYMLFQQGYLGSIDFRCPGKVFANSYMAGINGFMQWDPGGSYCDCYLLIVE